MTIYIRDIDDGIKQTYAGDQAIKNTIAWLWGKDGSHFYLEILPAPGVLVINRRITANLSEVEDFLNKVKEL